MELDFAEYKSIQIPAMEVDQLLPEAKERIKENPMLDGKYRELCKQVTTGGNIEKGFSISNNLLCWKNSIYVPEGLWQRVIQSEHDSKVAGYFGRERTLELVTRNF
jgi:hypothetical protein